jgi:subtilisin family serine protease
MTIWGMNSMDTVMAVGNVSEHELNTDAQTPHHSSSRGPGQLAKFFKKPDCVAPTYGKVYFGESVRSLPTWGTSGACPQVAGLAALILQHCPKLSPKEIANIIRTTCRPLKDVNGNDASLNCVGHGMIDCVSALEAVLPARRSK